MLDEFHQKWHEWLLSGKVETITRETHPFALADDVDLCSRCGERSDADNPGVFRVVSMIQEVDGREVARPMIISECPACEAVEDRYVDATYAA